MKKYKCLDAIPKNDRRPLPILAKVSMNIEQLMQTLGLQRAYQSYQQNIGQPFAAVAGGIGRGYLGLDKPQYGGLLAEDMYRTGQALGNMPGIGAPAGAFSVGAKAVAQVPSLLADAVQMMRANPEAGLLALTAYHGSPYRFSKFDASKIGSGEGAQTYGHGLYFAGSPDTAKYYSKTLGDWDFEYASPEARQQLKSATDYADGAWSGLRSALTHADGDKNKAADILSSQYQSGVKDEEMRSAYRLMAQMLRDGRLMPAHTGRFYEVDIPDEMIGKMIDWDKPIGRQSKQVKEAIQQTRSMLPQNAIDDLGGDLSLLYGPNVTVNQFLNTWESLTGKTGSGEAALRQFGVPGVKYFDEQSRQKGKGTRNFVVFPGEEEAVRILNVE